MITRVSLDYCLSVVLIACAENKNAIASLIISRRKCERELRILEVALFI